LDSLQDYFRMTFQHIFPSSHVHRDLLQVYIDFLLGQMLTWSRNLKEEPDFVDSEIIFIIVYEVVEIAAKLGIGWAVLAK